MDNDSLRYLTEKEYFSKIHFNEDAISAKDIIGYPAANLHFFNRREGLVRCPLEGQLDWELPFKQLGKEVIVNIGDFLKLRPEERCKWKPFFIKAAITNLEINVIELLFPENEKQLGRIESFWNKRSEMQLAKELEPWFTTEEMEKSIQATKSRIHTSKDKVAFSENVLDKYKQKGHWCLDLHSNKTGFISFLNFNNETISEFHFEIKDALVYISKEDVENIPPREKKHWQKHIIQ